MAISYQNKAHRFVLIAFSRTAPETALPRLCKRFESVSVMESEIGKRLKRVREALDETQRSMSDRLNLGPSTWQKIERGISLPSGDTLVKIGDLGFSLDWIMRNKGVMRITDCFEFSGEPISGEPARYGLYAINPALFGQIADTVTAVYNEQKAHISPRDFGILCAEKYSEIVSASDKPYEWSGMVKLMAMQLRKELAAPANDAGRR